MMHARRINQPGDVDLGFMHALQGISPQLNLSHYMYGYEKGLEEREKIRKQIEEGRNKMNEE